MKPYRALYRLTQPHSAVYGSALVMVLVATACYLLLPPQLGKFLDALQSVSKGGSGSGAIRAILVSSGLLALNAVVNLAQALMITFTSEKIINTLRARFFSHVLRQPLDESQRRPLGKIASEFSSDLALVQDGISVKLVDFFRNALFTLGAFAAVFYIDFRMTLFAVAAILLVAGVMLGFMKAATKAILDVQQQRAKLVSVLVESAANAYVIQAFGRIGFMEGRFAGELKRAFQRIRKHALLMAAMSPVSLIVFSGLMVAAVAYGVEELRHGRMQIPGLVSYFAYALMLTSSVTQVSFLGGQLRQAGSVLLKHESCLEEPLPGQLQLPARAISSGGGPLEVLVGDVTFQYAGAEGPALRSVSFSIPPGSITGVAGESGAGKSTVVGVLAGLLKPRMGRLEVRQEGALLPPEEQFSAMAIVPQEPFLFNGTFFENIAFGREGITRSDVLRVARAARIHDEISQRPGGYDGDVEEGGRNLSRGQRQRIALARALAGRPSLLLLDEATSSLDPASERAIRALVEEMKGLITIVVIAHQGELLGTIDRLIVLDHGIVTYQGAPDERETGDFMNDRVSAVAGRV